MRYYIIIVLLVLIDPVYAYTDSDIECLATNVYHEGRGESRYGQLLIMDVVIERYKDRHYPNSICEVVYQKKQFSWTNDKKHTIENRNKFNKIRKLVKEFINNWIGIGNGAILYHASYMTPYWASSYKLVRTIDNHKFYKRK